MNWCQTHSSNTSLLAYIVKPDKHSPTKMKEKQRRSQFKTTELNISRLFSDEMGFVATLPLHKVLGNKLYKNMKKNPALLMMK